MKRILLLFTLAGALLAQPQYLPNPAITPGATNPAVTQENIKTTICKSGWTKTIRPPVRFTNALKLQEMANLGLKGKAGEYELDHLVSLEVGGAPFDPANLWPEPWPAARLKDVVESSLKRRICALQITLVDAQAILEGDWTAEYRRLKGKTVAEALTKR